MEDKNKELEREEEKQEFAENTTDKEDQEEKTENKSAEETEDEKDCDCKEEIDELTKLKEEKSELQDKYLRLYSEFENFRRRTAKEKIETIANANQNLILDILPVVDDFERAMKSMTESSDIDSVKKGVELIFNKLNRTLTDKGLKEIDCLEKEFDPEIHEAVTKIPAPKKKLKGKVVDQIQKGYKLNDKVIRHSKVVVGE